MTRIVNAPAAAVYAFWTVPDRMERWLGKVEADVRPGGRYRFESDAGEGKTFVFTGEYLALDPGRRIVHTFLAGRRTRLRRIPTSSWRFAFARSPTLKPN